jgi:hypothetical protein
MKISGSTPAKPTSAIQRRKGASSTSATSDDFLGILGGVESASSATAPSPVSDIQPISTVGALLSLQEMPDEEIQNRKAYQQSKQTIDTLETLRQSLLTGRVPPHVLRDLQHMVRSQKHQGTDPKLQAIVDDIELRAAVELAKLEMASNG